MQNVKNILSSFLQKMRAGTGGNISIFVTHKILPLIEEHPLLKEETERRIRYHETLAKSERYKHLIEKIHASLLRAQKAIEPEKLPEITIGMFGHTINKNHVLKHYFPTWRDLHSFLSQEKPWYTLGEHPRGHDDLKNDSQLFPWRNVLKQYELVLDLFHEAKINGACKTDITKLEKGLREDVRQMKQLLEEPWLRDQIGSFQSLQKAVWMNSPPSGKEEEYALHSAMQKAIHEHFPQSAKENAEEIKKCAEIVCDELLLFLEKQDDPVPEKDGALVIHKVTIDIEGHNVTFKGETHHYKGNCLPWRIFRLCATEEPDGKGMAAVNHFKKTENALNRTICRINKWWRKKTNHRILRMDRGYVNIDPQPARICNE